MSEAANGLRVLPFISTGRMTASEHKVTASIADGNYAMEIQRQEFQATLPGFTNVQERVDPNSDFHKWVLLPTGGDANRQFLAFFCGPNREEVYLALLLSHDVWIRVPREETTMEVVRRILRRESYLRAVLVQSRGTPARSACTNKCSRSLHPFEHCVRIAGV
ncbi:hypothetical protein CDD81_2813 [Ophiocordyceps australis]|uniref:Uncharacterized protein n=1 Tax=Ophiocordyceps australis TaxID=1399860 RepID=A0A2C5XEF6_9HYPO|nr:hypothetical protein CDD81_2813 [Ophiocordyceps australis]